MMKGLIVHESMYRTNFVNIEEVPPDVFARRLSLVLNNFYLALFRDNAKDTEAILARYTNATTPVDDVSIFARRPPVPPAPPPPPLSPPSPDGADSAAMGLRFYSAVANGTAAAARAGLRFVPAATAATASVHTPIYVCRIGWAATLLLASAALLAAGAAALVLQVRSVLAPDTLRSVASMAYASPHFRSVPRGGTTLDGVERAQLLHDVRVRVGDINGDGTEGEVAFVAAEDVETRELDSKRLYK
jgi:hypothetical protein